DAWQGQIETYGTYKGKLAEGPSTIAALFKFDGEFNRAGERLASYASLKASGDMGDSNYQRMSGRLQMAWVKASEAGSYVQPELLAIPQGKMDAFMLAPGPAEWKLALERIVRYRPHTLSQGEEQLLAMSGQMADGP